MSTSQQSTQSAANNRKTPNRWLILAGGVLVQLALGGVYAWSTFSRAFTADASNLQLSSVQAAIPFELCIGMIFIGTFLGGRIQDKHGPRLVALAGVLLYSVGIVLSSFARDSGQFWMLIVGYGLISGFGLGLAYIVPVAMLQKWFPDKAGLITGLAVGGFGFGAVITSPVAQNLIAANPAEPAAPFLPLGLAYLVFGLLGAWTFANPPKGYRPPSMSQAEAAEQSEAEETDDQAQAHKDFTQAQALRTPQWYMLTAVLALSVAAGISLISVAASAASQIAGYSAAAAASLVGIMGLFNGAGRILWGWISDRIGKMPSFVGILALQGIALIILPHAGSVMVFAVLAAVIYTCYGGAFGTMPSTAGKFFGTTHSGGIYGLMLVGWSVGGVAGPLLASWMIGSSSYTLAFTVIGAVAVAAAIIPLLTKPPAPAQG